MANPSRRRTLLIAVVAVVLVLLLLLLTMCRRNAPAPAPTPAPAQTVPTRPSVPAERVPDQPTTPEVLGEATLKVPPQVTAGAAFSAEWTGPDNRGDYLTIVPPDAANDVFASYRETKDGAALELTAPVKTGPHEVRYVTARSKAVLARALIEVLPMAATLDGPAQVTQGSAFQAAWTGPNNKGDYVTIVPKGAADSVFASYADTSTGSPLKLTAPIETGDAELRYVSGQGRTVLARRPITVVSAPVSLDAPAQAVAGADLEVTWTGPNNTGDYITIVPIQTPDDQYGNYANTSVGSPLKLLAPIMDGDAELRYVSGQGRRVLARRPMTVTAARITIDAPAECAAGADVTIAWTGPNNRGDYITIVPSATPDGQFAAYANTSAGSPLTVKAPKAAGNAEVRYMSGQGSKVLARVTIKVTG
jgi:Ca-activated chloride channel homolog